MTAQTIYRIACRHKPYSQIGNAMLRDKRLSIEARGALAMIISHPSNWTITLAWLCNAAGVGRDKARGMICEMEKVGYCQRRRTREKDGTLGGYEYIFTDEPDTFTAPAPEKPSVDGSTDVRPGTGQPTPENPTPSKEEDTDQNNIPNTPPTPSQARGRAGRGVEALIEQTRGRPGCASIVEHLIEPLLRRLHFDAPDQLYAVGEIADRHRSVDTAILSTVRDRLIKERRHSFKPSDLERALGAALASNAAHSREAAKLVDEPRSFKKGTVVYEAALQKARREDPKHAARIEQNGMVKFRQREADELLAKEAAQCTG